MNKKVFLGLFFIIIVIVISFISYSNRFIDENEALKISTEKLAQPYDKYQVFLIKDTKRLSYLDSKYYETLDSITNREDLSLNLGIGRTLRQTIFTTIDLKTAS